MLAIPYWLPSGFQPVVVPPSDDFSGCRDHRQHRITMGMFITSASFTPNNTPIPLLQTQVSGRMRPGKNQATLLRSHTRSPGPSLVPKQPAPGWDGAECPGSSPNPTPTPHPHRD